MTLKKYFQTISEKLLSMTWGEDASWADDDQQLLGQMKYIQKEVKFLSVLCGCLDEWDDDDDDVHTFRSAAINTALRVVWADKKHKARRTILDRLTNTWPVHVHAFHSLAFELQVKIQQSKPLVEQWCQHFVHSSLKLKLMQHNFPQPPYIMICIHNIRVFTDRFSSHRAAKIVPFKNQIDILNDKLVILGGVIKDLVFCTDSRRNKLLQSMNFVGAFAINAACLACLYWAKEADEETSTQMNIVLFHMLHRFIAYAPRVTILISQNLRASSDDSIVLSAIVASLVDFFFEHLDDDDFLILRDPLIRLFTSLAANLSHEKAAAAEDVVRSQVYALFSEHSYLLLPIF